MMQGYLVEGYILRDDYKAGYVLWYIMLSNEDTAFSQNQNNQNDDVKMVEWQDK